MRYNFVFNFVYEVTPSRRVYTAFYNLKLFYSKARSCSQKCKRLIPSIFSHPLGLPDDRSTLVPVHYLPSTGLVYADNVFTIPFFYKHQELQYPGRPQSVVAPGGLLDGDRYFVFIRLSQKLLDELVCLQSVD